MKIKYQHAEQYCPGATAFVQVAVHKFKQLELTPTCTSAGYCNNEINRKIAQIKTAFNKTKTQFNKKYYITWDDSDKKVYCSEPYW